MSQRHKVFFDSHGTRCAAWHYPGSNGACLVMAAGLAVPKEAGTDILAERIHQAGFSLLAFDYRRLGESEGGQRGLVRMNEQLEDWQAAIAYARALPEVDQRKVAVWGFSITRSHIFNVAARNPDLAAAVAHAASADGLAAMRHALRYVTPGVLLKFVALGVLDAIGTRLGRDPILIPLNGKKGELASIHTPDSQNGPKALNPNGKYDHLWPRHVVAASSALRVAFYRPGRVASRIQIPFLVVEFAQDGVAPPGPAAKAARRAPRGEFLQLPGGHYAALIDQTDAAVDAIVDFLRRHVLDVPAAAPPAPAATGAL